MAVPIKWKKMGGSQIANIRKLNLIIWSFTEIYKLDNVMTKLGSQTTHKWCCVSIYLFFTFNWALPKKIFYSWWASKYMYNYKSYQSTLTTLPTIIAVIISREYLIVQSDQDR